jgi:hypothetical protein
MSAAAPSSVPQPTSDAATEPARRAPAAWRWLQPANPARATLVLILVTAAVRVGLGILMDFGNGESYYLAGTRTPHLSYFDQPPLSMWIGWAMLTLTGSDDPAAIRLPFIAMFAGTTWLMFALTRRLYSPLAGYHAALLLNVSAVFTISVGGWFQPDGPLMLFWMLTTWGLVNLLLKRPEDLTPAHAWGWWLFVGLMLGLTGLSKYHAVFLVFGAGLFVLSRRALWRWLSHPAPYVGALLCLALLSPVFVWNVQHDWASFAFQSGRSVEGATLRPDWLLRSVLGQMVWLLPWVWLPMIWVFVRALTGGREATADWFLACLAVGPVAFFTVVALWAPVGFHFHWQAPGYLMLFPLLGRLAVGGLERRPRLTRAWLGGSALATALVILLLGSHIATNWMARAIPLEDDPTLEALEWRALRDDLRTRGLLGQPGTFAAAVHWVEGGKVDSAVGGALPVYVLSDDPRNLAFTVDPAALQGWDALLMGTAHRLREPEARFSQTFRGGITLIDRFDLRRGGDVVVRDIGVFLARDFTIRHQIDFDGTDPDSYFGPGWGGASGDPAGRAIEAESAVLTFDIEPRVRYGRLDVSARSTGGQQTLVIAWQGRPVARVVLPQDGSAVDVSVSVPGVRRVGRRQGVLTFTPERPGVEIGRVVLTPVSDDATGSPTAPD